jgi:Raf kinase inhibitor-like YbhB/YbcL family protein
MKPDAYNIMGQPVTNAKLIITSLAFKNKEIIPAKYTCDGININPPLTIEGIPAKAKTLALVMVDADITDEIFVHWVIWNIPPYSSFPENYIPRVEGTNSFSHTRYMGPCPPEGETRRYFFKIYAVSKILDLKGGSNVQMLWQAMENHILSFGEIMCIYTKPEKAVSALYSEVEKVIDKEPSVI